MPFVTEGTMSRTSAGRNDDWGTPQALYDALDREFRFDVDVCAHEGNHKHERYWTVEDDGLKQDWSGLTCFMNPPYGRTIGQWIHKAAESATRGGGGRGRGHPLPHGRALVGRCHEGERDPHDKGQAPLQRLRPGRTLPLVHRRVGNTARPCYKLGRRSGSRWTRTFRER